jgi:replicative DNA helicase
MASGLISCDVPHSEFDMLTALYELALQNPDRGRAVSLKLTPQMFSGEGTADAFRLVRRVLSVCEQPTTSDITRDEHYEKCRDLVIDVLAKGAANFCAYSLGAERYVHELRADYSRLQAERAAQDLSALVEGGASPVEIAEAARAVSDAAGAIETDSRTPTLQDALDEYLRMEAVPTIPTQFQPFDRLGGGFPVGGLTVLAAPPSVGKSALSLQLLLGAMEYDRSLVAIWCLGEMTLEAFARRAVCHWSTRGSQAPVSMSSAEQRTELARGSVISLAMHIADRLKIVKPPLSIDRIEAEVIQSKAKLVVIDYVQLVELGDAQDRRAEIDGVVRRLRRLSLEHGVAVVGVSNVSKIVSAETRIGAIGKESSELDFAADLLLLGVAEDREDQDGLRSVKWACKKNRHGQCLDADTMFDGRLQTFTDATAGREAAFDNWG